MRVGIDTTFLVHVEVAGLSEHKKAYAMLEKLLREEKRLGLTQQVLAEFVHIITDPKRFDNPLDMEQAISRALYWWNAEEVERVLPTERTGSLTFELMKKHSLGRKRVLDTQLAATFLEAGISSVVSSNERDFRVFGVFQIITL